jgi:hypothetical protein
VDVEKTGASVLPAGSGPTILHRNEQKKETTTKNRELADSETPAGCTIEEGWSWTSTPEPEL